MKKWAVARVEGQWALDNWQSPRSGTMANKPWSASQGHLDSTPPCQIPQPPKTARAGANASMYQESLPSTIQEIALQSSTSPNWPRCPTSPHLFRLRVDSTSPPLLVITTGYAILFAARKRLNFPLELFVVLAGLFPFVGIFQALLAAWQKPRPVSALAGMGCYVVALSSSFLHGEFQTYIGPLIYCTIYRTIAGNIYGVLIGGFSSV